MPRKCRNWRNAPLMILIAALLGGCSGDRAPYPGGFPPLAAVESRECPDISGQYSNKNSADLREVLFQYGGDAYLFQFGEDDKWRRLADLVVITQPDARTIEFLVPSDGFSSMLRRSLSRDDKGYDRDDKVYDKGYSCDNGMVVVSSTAATFFGASGSVFGTNSKWKELRLAPTIEGSLAAEVVSVELIAIFFFIPIRDTKGRWFLISEVPEAAVEQPAPTP